MRKFILFVLVISLSLKALYPVREDTFEFRLGSDTLWICGNKIWGTNPLLYMDYAEIADSLYPGADTIVDLGSPTKRLQDMWGFRYWFTDPTKADSAKLYDDGDTTRIESDNPIKIGNSIILQTDGMVKIDSLEALTSTWWYCKYMDAIDLSPGGSGATQITPTDNTIGGYQFNAATEYLYFNGGACNNWDEASDLEIKIRWELNAASVGANDSVFLDLACWYKAVDEDTTKYQALTEGVLVGNLAQYTMKTTTFTVDYDLANNVVQIGDIFAFRLSLNTTRSDIDDVIINFGRFKYRTNKPQPITY